MADRFEGVGVTPRELKPGTVVMVPVGQVTALVNGGPCIIAWAQVLEPVTADDAAVFTDPKSMWWLNVYLSPYGPPMPQMYRADTILGVPALGLHMTGAPPAHTGEPNATGT